MAVDAQAFDLAQRTRRRRRLKGFLAIARRKYLGSASALILVGLVFVALTAPLLAPYPPLELHTDDFLAPPSSTYLFGTDEVGRDVLSRLMFGAQVSLIVSLTATTISSSIGIVLGMTSGFFGGKYDLLVQRFVDSLQAFPGLILAMLMVTTLGQSLFNVILAISIGGWAGKARIVRSATLSLKQNTYVDAARAIGATNTRIMALYIFPNAIAVIIVGFSITLGGAILSESSLSFLGLGPPPPDPTWGSMLSGASRNHMNEAPWLALIPGIAITLVVLSFNLLGDAIRDILDPRLRGSR